jgi:hypothetical protein
MCSDKIIIEITELNTNVNLEIDETCEVVVLEIQDVGTAGQDAINYIRRHDFVSNVSYCGYAKKNSLETEAKWTISKIAVATDGSTTTTTATNVKWSERLIITYN